MKIIYRVLAAGLLLSFFAFRTANGAELTIKAINKLPFARSSQTVELSEKDLASLGEKDLNKIHVKDAAGKELLCQAVDSDGDALRKADMVIFQSDFGSNETKTFTVSVGTKWEYKKEDFKAFGRFVRERFDDFAWENDRIAHRTYGKALETWEGEPLTSSSIDIWSKRTSRMVVNDWYMVDNYHAEGLDGYDDYSAGTTRGDGGTGIWASDKLWVSRNFVSSRTLANGPIRVMFELTYEAFDVSGMAVSEVKRVTLDAGQNLDHYQCTYKAFAGPNKTADLTQGIGLKKVSGEQKELNGEHGWLAKWEPMEKNGGMQGLAVIYNPTLIEKQVEDKLNQLVLVKVPDDMKTSHWAGFYWDKSGQFADFAAWKKYVDEFAQGTREPIEVRVEK